MDEAWEEIKVLLVPLLWLQTSGIVVIGVQLRGIEAQLSRFVECGRDPGGQA